MNIWLFQTGEPLPLKSGVRKMRTAILADNLLEHGHSIFWWASAFDHQQKRLISKRDKTFSLSPGFKIRVLRGCRYHKNISLGRYINYQIVALKFRIQSRRFPKPDAIVASMPDYLIAYEAARYAQKNGIPYLVDIRDLWPDIFLDRFKKMGMTGLGKMVLARDFMLLDYLLKRADALTAVSNSYLQWGLKKIGRSQNRFDKMFYLGYKVDSKKAVFSNEDSEIPAWLKGRKDQKLFVFIGTFGISYELDLVIETARYFNNAGRSDVFFVIAGAGEKFDLISKKISGLQNVVLPGWIGEKAIGTLLGKSYAGLLPYVKDAPQGLPNKPFEYLSAGLPLINSLEGEMKELINHHEFGLNYLSGDLKGLYKCIEVLASDPALHNKMSQNALDFFNKYGDASKIYDAYCKFIEELAGRNGRRLL